MANLTERDLSMLPVGHLLYGTGDKLGKLWIKCFVHPQSWPWKEFDLSPGDLRKERAMRSSEYLAALDLAPHKPRELKAYYAKMEATDGQ